MLFSKKMKIVIAVALIGGFLSILALAFGHYNLFGVSDSSIIPIYGVGGIIISVYALLQTVSSAHRRGKAQKSGAF